MAICEIRSSELVRNVGVSHPVSKNIVPIIVASTRGSSLSVEKKFGFSVTHQIPKVKESIAVTEKKIIPYPSPTSPNAKKIRGKPIFPVFPKVKGAK